MSALVHVQVQQQDGVKLWHRGLVDDAGMRLRCDAKPEAAAVVQLVVVEPGADFGESLFDCTTCAEVRP